MDDEISHTPLSALCELTDAITAEDLTRGRRRSQVFWEERNHERKVKSTKLEEETVLLR
jgi:hypothetical protein